MSRTPASERKKPASDGETAAVRRPLRVGALGDSIGYALRRAQLASTAEFLEAMQAVDLRPTQFSVLILISENPGVRQNEVCVALGLQKANFVPLLNELERRGLAERRPGVPDRRASALHLTEKGVAVLRRALQLHGEWESRVATRLGPEGRDRLLSLLAKLT